MGHLLIVVLLVSGKYIIRFRFCKIAEKLADPPLKQSMERLENICRTRTPIRIHVLQKFLIPTKFLVS